MFRFLQNRNLLMPFLCTLLLLLVQVILTSSIPVAAQTTAKGASNMDFTIQSSDFANGGDIPRAFTCDGEDRSPALSWSGAPEGTKAFVLIADDPDAPAGTWVHWVIFNIPAKTQSLPPGVEKKEQLPDGSKQGRNDFRKIGYGGPCPPPGKPHRYFFKLYALGAELGLQAGASKADVEQAMTGHILTKAELMGRYKR
jgi:Raf kinase inhibitor-like YbhB/YbcL family protein